MLLEILAVLILAIIGFLIVAAMQPSEFRVTRSLPMNAPASAVFDQVNDFHKWEAWSPWAKLDPNAKNTFEGPASGVGSVFKWEGNNKVGAGIMTIIDSVPSQLIRIRLEFLKPFKATNTAEFTFRPEAGQTVVTWSMYGENKFMGKVMSLLMNCQKMIGGQFDKGLAQMKSVVEGE